MNIPIYRYHIQQSDGLRFYFSTNPQLGQGWTYDGIAFYVPNNNDPQAVPIHQFHYDQSHTYGGWRFHYRTDLQPTKAGWIYDETPFKVYNTPINGTVPIYEYHCIQEDGLRFHFSFAELSSYDEWTKDGVAFYAYIGEIQ